MELRRPTLEELPSYAAALQRGWSPNTLDDAAGRRELDLIAADPAGFLASLLDRDASREPVVLPDGSTAERIPGYRMWMWDGEFAGSISFRWRPGTEELPPHVLGHVGYTVVPWKRRRGYATEALRQLLPLAAVEGLRYVEVTTDPDNVASQRVIEANGGVLVERFRKLPAYGSTEGLRYRIDLPAARVTSGVRPRMSRCRAGR
jgi:predicted acetyltransferase